MKKLNETTANELLHEIRKQLDFDWVDDNVKVEFYMMYDRAEYLIGSFYSLDLMGDYLLEHYTIKAYKIKVEDCNRFNNRFIEIAIVLNNIQ